MKPWRDQSIPGAPWVREAEQRFLAFAAGELDVAGFLDLRYSISFDPCIVGAPRLVWHRIALPGTGEGFGWHYEDRGPGKGLVSVDPAP